MKIVFFGTPDYVLPILTKLHKTYVTGPGKSPITAVVTQSPKPTGRKQVLTYSAIDKWAHERGIDTRYDFNKPLPEADLGIVASYKGLIPQNIIDSFPHGVLVVHPSLLPKFRWGSPVPATIVTNSNPTGVTIMKMDEKFDHGPIVAQAKEEILPDDTTDTLRDRLFAKSADVLIELLEAYMKNKINLKEQDHSQATFATHITKQDAFIELEFLKKALEGEVFEKTWEVPFIKGYSQESTPENLERFIRAMQSWPQAWTLIEDKRLKLLKSHIEDGKLILDEVQLEGKNPITWKQFKQSYLSSTF